MSPGPVTGPRTMEQDAVTISSAPTAPIQLIRRVPDLMIEPPVLRALRWRAYPPRTGALVRRVHSRGAISRRGDDRRARGADGPAVGGCSRSEAGVAADAFGQVAELPVLPLGAVGSE